MGVHIADVSYFVKEDSSLDKTASHRATSVYLVQKVRQRSPKISWLSHVKVIQGTINYCLSGYFRGGLFSRISRVSPRENFHFNVWHHKNREINFSRISPPTVQIRKNIGLYVP